MGSAGASQLSLVDESTRRAQYATPKKSRKTLWITLGVVFALLAAGGITVGVLVSQDIIRINSGSGSESSAATGSDDATDSSGSSGSSGSGSSDSSDSASSDSSPASKPVKCPTSSDIPDSAAGTWMDPTSWLDMAGLNCTFTSKTVGDLPLAGLNTTWDDSARANPNVPQLNKPWGSYEKLPIRGVNLGGWLSLEPFITPSLFKYDKDAGVIDEYTLCDHLGSKAKEVLEKHYATFITERDFKNIAAAGLDHVRIPFSYWAVETFDNDPYVEGVSWRYLLRGIEWARKYGIRVNLDLHGLPGSQNGWNHSGRAGIIRFLDSTDGDKNAKRALEIHDRLSKFFAQDRYNNVIAFYGLGNEPAQALDKQALTQWTSDAYDIVEKNGVKGAQVFSDSMRGLNSWAGALQGKGDKLVIDSHVYSIFDPNLISMTHKEKISLACKDWSSMIANSITSSGFGPTMVGEWSQADTDCTEHLNGVGGGSRWEGTFSEGGAMSPSCASGDKKCSCEKANANPDDYSDEYRAFLKTFAIAQMDAFEKAWGWFYWTWKAEGAYQWSYEAGMKGGFMPKVAYERDWDCGKSIPSFGDLSEYY